MNHTQVITIGETFVSSALLTERFACNLSDCNGQCCVEGESGAPLEEEEIEIIMREYDSFAPFMTERGRIAVQQQGVAFRDRDGDWVTPLVGDAGECAYARFDACDVGLDQHSSCASGDNLHPSCAFCAIERAFFLGKTTFRKPISCWLYPIRIQPLASGCALNVHHWRLCASARLRGQKENIPLYQFLKEAIIAKFGAGFYEGLRAAAGA